MTKRQGDRADFCSSPSSSVIGSAWWILEPPLTVDLLFLGELIGNFMSADIINDLVGFGSLTQFSSFAYDTNYVSSRHVLELPCFSWRPRPMKH